MGVFKGVGRDGFVNVCRGEIIWANPVELWLKCESPDTIEDIDDGIAQLLPFGVDVSWLCYIL